MSEIPEPLRQHLAQDCTTLCHCWRVIRRDGEVLGFTDHDRPVTVDGVTYEPGSGLSQSEVSARLGLASTASEVEGALTSEAISQDDVGEGLFDGAEVETLLVNWREPTQHHLLRKAVIARITQVDGRFVAELESVARNLDKPNGRYLRKACDAALGDARCGVDLEDPALNGSGVVESVVAPGILVVEGLGGFELGFFSDGGLTWTDGALAGRSARVRDHKRDMSGTVLVVEPASSPAPGAGFSITAGCDKRFETCKAKFANAVNFRGFPHLPGNDAAYGYVRDGMDFDGRPLVE